MLQANGDVGLLSTKGIRPPNLRADAASRPALEPREGDVAINSFYGSTPRGYAPGSALASGDASGGARAGESKVYALRRGARVGGSHGSGEAGEVSGAQVHQPTPAHVTRMVGSECRWQIGASMAHWQKRLMALCYSV